jgi:hypothetical protein
MASKGTRSGRTACGLERFSNPYVFTGFVEGGFFLRKKPLCGMVPVYSNWRTAIPLAFARLEAAVVPLSA